MVSLFSESIDYITIGDEYEKKVPKKPEDEGLKCFLTEAGHKGSLPQVTFGWKLYGGFIGLNEGDEYRDPGYVERRARIDAAKRFIGNTPFKIPSPGKKSCGVGGYEGCFEKGVPHQTEYMVLKKGELPAPKEPEPRNIVIGPCKKGTYGVPGTLLSNSFGGMKADWTGQEYICDPFDGTKKFEKEQRERDKAIMAEKVPFKASCKTKKFFDESNGAGASQIYRLQRPLPPRKPDTTPAPPPREHPWRPNHKGKSGVAALFGSADGAFPPYREDPFEIKESQERSDRVKDKPRYGTWRPVSVSKSLPVKSIEFGRTL